MKTLHIGDMHLGEHGNSADYNEKCIEFVRWVAQKAIDLKVDKVIQHGDFFHTRHKISVETLNYGIVAAKIFSDLKKTFGIDVIVLKGNHDLYYLDRLDVSSVNAIDSYVDVVDTLTTIHDPFSDKSMLIAPWVVDDVMWDQIVEKSNDHEFLCSHLELNGFKVNDGYVMDSGWTPTHLKRFERVITGHYHTFQTKGNIDYIGTPYPITMSEANEEHGVFCLDWATNDFEFFEYDKVRVISVPYSELDDILDSSDLDPKNTSIRVEFPDDIEDETIIGETMERLKEMDFAVVKNQYTGKKVKAILESDVDVDVVGNIDQAVVEAIRASSEISGVDKTMLEQQYQSAIERGQEG